MFIRLLTDLARLALLLLVLLAVTELSLRVLNIPDPAQNLRPDLAEPHPYYGWALRPGISVRMEWRDSLYEINHSPQGFRSNDVLAEERPEWAQNRVLLLGDSVLYGLGSADHETFPEILKGYLPKSEIVNSGVPGYGLRQELAMLDLLGAKIQPDLIVVIFRWNDPEDDMRHSTPDYAFDADGRVVRTDVEVPADFDPLAEREALPLEPKREGGVFSELNTYRAARNSVRELRDTFLPPRRRHALRGWLRMVKNTVTGKEHDRIDRPNDKARAWQSTHRLLALARARSQEIGARLLVVSVPAYSLVSETRYGEGPLELNARVEANLTAACTELGIDYVDLLPAMQKLDAASPEPLYFYRDNHLAPAGNAVVADLLKDILPAYLN